MAFPAKSEPTSASKLLEQKKKKYHVSYTPALGIGGDRCNGGHSKCKHRSVHILSSSSREGENPSEKLINILNCRAPAANISNVPERNTRIVSTYSVTVT